MSRYCHFHFTDEGTKVQKGEVTCPKPYSMYKTEPQLEPTRRGVGMGALGRGRERQQNSGTPGELAREGLVYPSEIPLKPPNACLRQDDLQRPLGLVF